MHLGDLLLAGYKEGPNNFSYNAKIGGRYNGAFTYYALKTLKKLKPGGLAQGHRRVSAVGELPAEPAARGRQDGARAEGVWLNDESVRSEK